MSRWRDEGEEGEEQYPALYPDGRVAHLRRMARQMHPDTRRLSHLVGIQYLFLAAMVASLLIFAPALRVRMPRQMWWLILLYALGGVSLIWGQRRRRR